MNSSTTSVVLQSSQLTRRFLRERDGSNTREWSLATVFVVGSDSQTKRPCKGGLRPRAHFRHPEPAFRAAPGATRRLWPPSPPIKTDWSTAVAKCTPSEVAFSETRMVSYRRAVTTPRGLRCFEVN